MHSHSSCPLNLRSPFLAWFSHLHLILYAKVSNCSSSAAFDCTYLPDCYFLLEMWQFSLQEFPPTPGYFTSRCDSLSSTVHWSHLPQPVPPSLPLVSIFPAETIRKRTIILNNQSLDTILIKFNLPYTLMSLLSI
jgi:hypothetical protein